MTTIWLSIILKKLTIYLNKSSLLIGYLEIALQETIDQMYKYIKTSFITYLVWVQ